MFRFMIRDVLWLTLVVGVVCGWMVNRRCEVERQRQIQTEMLEARNHWGMVVSERDADRSIARSASQQEEVWKTFAQDLQRELQRNGYRIQMDAKQRVLVVPNSTEFEVSGGDVAEAEEGSRLKPAREE